jgi:ketosteroid isomerase-like protein
LLAAVNAGDVPGILGCWAADGVLLPPHHEAVHGHAAIAEYFRSVFAVRRLTFAFTESTVTVLGDMALERLSYTAQATTVTGGLLMISAKGSTSTRGATVHGSLSKTSGTVTDRLRPSQ